MWYKIESLSEVNKGFRFYITFFANKLQYVGIAADIWLWIQDYLSNRRQTTVKNLLEVRCLLFFTLYYTSYLS